MSMVIFPDEATTAADEAKVRAILSRWTFPPNVRGWELDFREDSTGDPAVYITFRVDDALDPSEETVRSVGEFSEQIDRELLRAGPHYFPHFRYQPPVGVKPPRRSGRRRLVCMMTSSSRPGIWQAVSRSGRGRPVCGGLCLPHTTPFSTCWCRRPPKWSPLHRRRDFVSVSSAPSAILR